MSGHEMTGAELKLIRDSTTLTRDEFAELAGVSGKTVRQWEFSDNTVPEDVAEIALKLHLDLLEWRASILEKFEDKRPGDSVSFVAPRSPRGTSVCASQARVYWAAFALAYHALTDDGISVEVTWK